MKQLLVRPTPSNINSANQFLASDYPGEGCYIDPGQHSLMFVVNGCVYMATNAARLCTEVEPVSPATERAPASAPPASEPALMGISERTLLRVIAVSQRPELIREIPDA